MNHPSVVTLDSHSAPRVLLAGERFVPVDLPAGTRCIYPNPAPRGFSDVEGLVRTALSRPLGSEPLSARLRPGMRLTLVLTDVMAPPPAGKGQDVRARILGTILALAAERRVDDIEIIVASGLERRLKPSELRRLVGARTFGAFSPERLRSHDAEDSLGLVQIGSLSNGTPVDLCRRVVESDLTIVVTTRTGHGGATPFSRIAQGLSSHRTLRGARTWKPSAVPALTASLGPAQEVEGLSETERLIADAIPLFGVEAVQSRARFPKAFSFLDRNEDDLTDRERSVQKALVHGVHHLPALARRALFESEEGSAHVMGVWAGDVELVSAASGAKVWQQWGVPISGQADVLVVPVPPVSPFNVGSFLNPLLAQALGTGYLFDRYRGKPLLKPGGTLVLVHPMTDRFDHKQHVASVDFVHSTLAETRDSDVLFDRHEPKFSRDPALIQMYRSSHAYHPSHAFSLWYAGESGRSHAGQVIVVGADNESIPALFGFETEKTMDDALYRARGGLPKSLDVICLKDPSRVFADVS